MRMCNEAFWERLKSRNEVRTYDEWGQRPVCLTLHDSHANLSDVLITWLFTLEEEKRRLQYISLQRIKHLRRDSAAVLSSENSTPPFFTDSSLGLKTSASPTT